MSGPILLYKKMRDAHDVAGNLAWSAKIGDRALVVSGAPNPGVEDLLELGIEERVIWRLLRLPRKCQELERCGHIQIDAMRGVLRGLLAIEFIDVVDAQGAKAILPYELKRLREEAAGRGGVSAVSSPLKGRVYRPEIGGDPAPLLRSATPSPAALPRVGTPMPRTSTPFPEATTADLELRLMIDKRHQAHKSQNHYEFLGLQPAATESQIKQAYTQLAKDLHPDRLSGSFYEKDQSLRERSAALFQRLQELHDALLPEKRAAYDRSIGLGLAPPQAKGRFPADARRVYQIAEAHLAKKEYAEAELTYEEARRLDPIEPRILIAQAWCIFINPNRPAKDRGTDARDKLQAIWREHKHPEAAYRLGRVLREMGDEEGATRRFQEALRIAPGHVDAAREVRLYEMRQQKLQEQAANAGGPFGLFKKKESKEPKGDK